jgi:hypothetical protein
VWLQPVIASTSARLAIASGSFPARTAGTSRS